jgi:hypothetical protein
MKGSNDETYAPVREVVEYLQSVHAGLRDHCRRLAADTSDEKPKMLLETLGRHEEDLHRTLVSTAREQSQEILETWIQYLPNEPIDDELKSLSKIPAGGWEEASESVLNTHNYIIDFCQRIVRQLSAPQVEEFFLSLANVERKKNKLLANDVNSMREL